jgi:predicted SprT family Zn-dependent metalloprotease
MTEADMKEYITRRVGGAMKRAEIHFGQKFIAPKILFKLRGGTAGFAKFTRDAKNCEMRYSVNFNMAIAMRHPKEFLARTVGHEVAHVIESQLYGKMSHSRAWKQIDILLGGDGTRCHSYNVEGIKGRNRTKVHYYKCSCCDKMVKLSTTKHNRMRKNPRAYIHSSCNGTLVYFSSGDRVKV